MKISSLGRALLLGTCLALLAAACQEEERGSPIPGGTPTAAVSGTPTATAEVPGSHTISSTLWRLLIPLSCGLIGRIPDF